MRENNDKTTHTHTHTHNSYKIEGSIINTKIVKNVRKVKQENLVKGSKLL